MSARKKRRVVETSTPVNIKNGNGRCSSLRFEVSGIDRAISKSKSLSDSTNDNNSCLPRKRKSTPGRKRKRRIVRKYVESSSPDEDNWETLLEKTLPSSSNDRLDISPEVTRDAPRPENPIYSIEKPIYPLPIANAGDDELSRKNRVESNSDSDDWEVNVPKEWRGWAGWAFKTYPGKTERFRPAPAITEKHFQHLFLNEPINIEKYLPGDRQIRNRRLMLEARNFDPKKIRNNKKKMGKGSSKIQKEIDAGDDPFGFPTVTLFEPRPSYRSVRAAKETRNPEIPQREKRGLKRKLESISTNDRDQRYKRKLLEFSNLKRVLRKPANSDINEKFRIGNCEEKSGCSDLRSLHHVIVDHPKKNVELTPETSKNMKTTFVSPLSQISINYASPVPIKNSPKKSSTTISIENLDPSFVDSRVTKRPHRRIGNLLYPESSNITDPISNADRPTISRNITFPLLRRRKIIVRKNTDEEFRTVRPIASSGNTYKPSIMSQITLDSVVKRVDSTKWLVQKSTNNLN